MQRLSAGVVVGVLMVLVAAGIVGARGLSQRGHATALIGASTPAADPLDPLTADEIQTAFTVIERSKRLAPGTFFPIVKLDEPAKSAAAWTPGQPVSAARVRERLRPRREQALRGGRRPQDEAARLVDAASRS